VSGFNTEYSGAYFAFIFLSEYTVLLYSCIIISFLFFSWLLPYSIFYVVCITLLLRFVFIWIRITFCRFRYDILIIVSWKILLPMVLIVFVIYFPLFIVLINMLYVCVCCLKRLYYKILYVINV
jgi:NADH:ubiquinone oxidoreductase subunit H